MLSKALRFSNKLKQLSISSLPRSQFSSIKKTTSKELDQVAEKPHDPKSLESLAAHNWHYFDPKHKSSISTHKSYSEQFIHKVPVVEVESAIVRCLGGTEINAGHPQVYIKLDTRLPGQAQTCKYCGLRYRMKASHHH